MCNISTVIEEIILHVIIEMVKVKKEKLKHTG